MLTRAENDLLTQTGPGTPMGNLVRRYWIPALLSQELPKPDGPPLRLKLLGEKLIALRDSSGKVALFDPRCPHRGADLFYGRNEECGIRCVYHGWKFDVEGNCVDMPSEPAETSFKHKVKITAYPCLERGGVVWTYMGPPEVKPAFPELEWTALPESHRLAARRLQECNWFQGYEGGWDTAHLPFLHRGDTSPGSRFFSRTGNDAVRDLPAQYEFVQTEFGLIYGSGRPQERGDTLWSVSLMFMPGWKLLRPQAGDARYTLLGWIPVDDENCMVWSIEYHPERPLSEDELRYAKSFDYVIVETIPSSVRPVRNKDNDYRIDRELQASGVSFTGVKGLGLQDSFIQESLGTIADRTRENLGSTDREIVLLRRHLLRIVRGLETGAELPGLDPSSYRARPAVFTVPKGRKMTELVRDAIRIEPHPAPSRSAD